MGERLLDPLGICSLSQLVYTNKHMGKRQDPSAVCILTIQTQRESTDKRDINKCRQRTQELPKHKMADKQEETYQNRGQTGRHMTPTLLPGSPGGPSLPPGAYKVNTNTSVIGVNVIYNSK